VPLGFCMIQHRAIFAPALSTRGLATSLVPGLATNRVFVLPTVLLGSGYLIIYVLLDWISYFEPYAQFAITPWNPNTGASIAVILMFGRRMIPFSFIAPLLADLVVRQLPLPLSIEMLSVVVIGGVYAGAGLLLLQSKLSFDRGLSSMRDLLILIVVTVVSAGFVATAYVGLLVAAGLIPTADLSSAMLRSWIGDVIGIMVVVPFALILWMRRSGLRISREALVQLAAILAAQTIVFGYADEKQLQLFYVVFLPIIWIAVRTGIEGVSIGVLITQVGLILGIQLVPEGTHDIIAFQTLMLILAITGLVVGELVTERRCTEAQLRLHQESLARVARFGSVSEFAAALAHELNQPLMAAGTYARVVEDAVRGGGAASNPVADTARKTVAQVERAAAVVQHLRALVRLDRSNRVACQVDDIVRQTIELCQPDLDRLMVSVRTVIAPNLPPVMVDKLQIEQALLNFMQNSMDALGKVGRGIISIDAAPAGADFIEVRVGDSGPGFPIDRIANPFLPFSSTKEEGLGIGLPLSRSIIEAHGGRIWIDSSLPGATICFTLPTAKFSRSRMSAHG
jgi:two-component system, LuxR family, sensor kinase FixL